MYLWLSYLFLGIVLAVFAAIVFTFFFHRKFFKKGYFGSTIVVLLFAAFFIAWCYSDVSKTTVSFGEILRSFDFLRLFDILKYVMDAFKISVNTAVVRALCNDYIAFRIAYGVLFLLTPMFSAFVVCELFFKGVGNYFAARRAFRKKADVILGYSENAMKYIAENPNCLIWDENLNKETREMLLRKGVLYWHKGLTANNLNRVTKRFGIHFILFGDSLYQKGSVISAFAQLPGSKQKKEKTEQSDTDTLDETVQLHVECSMDEMDELISFFAKDKTNRVLFTSFSNHELTAVDFIQNASISKFMPRSFFEPNFSLKSDKEVHVVMLGMDKSNCELLRMMLIQYQFAKEVDGKFVTEPVHYHVFAKSDFEYPLINHIENEFDACFEGSDFPPCDRTYTFSKRNIYPYSTEVKSDIKTLVGENTFIQIVIAFGSDLENIAYLNELRTELGDVQNVHYAVKLTDKKSDEVLDNQVSSFGSNTKNYQRNQIINDDLIYLAQKVNNSYCRINDKKTFVGWCEMPAMRRYSNLYNSLSLFFKFGLAGLEITHAEKGMSLDEYTEVIPSTEGKGFAALLGLRSNHLLAFIEHNRWSMHYFLSGYKPLRLADFKVDMSITGKNKVKHKREDAVKRHACLTDYYTGLMKLVKVEYLMNIYGEEHKTDKLDEVNENSPEIMDFATVYSYDFLLTECAYQHLSELGYGIALMKK